MVVLSRKDILDMIKKENMVENYKDLELQVTPNGFDLRLCALIEVKEAGVLTIDKSKVRKPVFGKIYVLKGYEDCVKDIKGSVVVKEGLVDLKRLTPYLAVSCEKINTPKNIKTKIEIRSSLFRINQAFIETGFGEAGYKGRLTFLLSTLLDTKIELGVRFAQIAFYELKDEADYEEQKEKSYQGGRII